MDRKRKRPRPKDDVLVDMLESTQGPAPRRTDSSRLHSNSTNNGTAIGHRKIGAGKQLIAMPRFRDVILGRGRAVQAANGNILMRETTKKHRVNYSALPRDKRKGYAEQVLKEIAATGARFLKPVKTDSSMEMWEEVDKEIALEKISHSLREKTRSSTESRGDYHREEDLGDVFQQAGSSSQRHVLPLGHGLSNDQISPPVNDTARSSLSFSDSNSLQEALRQLLNQNPVTLFGSDSRIHPPSSVTTTPSQAQARAINNIYGRRAPSPISAHAVRPWLLSSHTTSQTFTGQQVPSWVHSVLGTVTLPRMVPGNTGVQDSRQSAEIDAATRTVLLQLFITHLQQGQGNGGRAEQHSTSAFVQRPQPHQNVGSTDTANVNALSEAAGSLISSIIQSANTTSRTAGAAAHSVSGVLSHGQNYQLLSQLIALLQQQQQQR